MMKSILKLHFYLMLKLPLAFLSGIRIKKITENNCTTTVKHRWINQNPFHSMYFAVQSMAAELATGILVTQKITKSNQKISMLVIQNKAIFLKKATGRIFFQCHDGKKIDLAIKQLLEKKEKQTFWVQSIGKNEQGNIVSKINFKWSIK